MKQNKNISRRKFIGTTAAASMAFSIVPRHVIGGPGHVAPSDQLSIAYIGCGTQGMREMTELIQNPQLRIVSVCDPNKFSTNYIDWSINGIRDNIRQALQDPSWGEGLDGIPGGRDVGQQFVDAYYGKQLGKKYKGCSSYADFRELLETEKDIDAVKVMTPDHLHATISVAAMKKGKHVVIHKPIANRMNEAKLTMETARTTGARTHLLAWSQRSGNALVKKWIQEGAIGTLKEIHNWSNRPVWQQWTSNPTETVPIPRDFDWDLWLGPVPERPYHPNYTHAVFRGWYDFGGGSIADMGHYSLWPLFMSLGIETPAYSAEARGTTTSTTIGQVSRGVNNTVAFPYSCTVRFRFGAQKELPPFDLYWYDGGMRPHTPDEWADAGKSLPREGMMLVGDKGKIMAGFNCENPELITEGTGSGKPADYTEKTDRSDDHWIRAFKNNTESPGSFLRAGAVTETILLGAVALRARERVVYDTEKMQITNVAEANQFLTREYRKGWEL
ncbi:MAG: Gfo/Idh/MocA family oxidoreductase [Cyclobacteriaceae bacterium]|nr:Gfo/Idh/MocA family oxidoreductase [Cyclobacteriaceae bacterium]